MPHGPDEPSQWIRRFAGLAAAGGRALDLAAGNGRHTRFLIECGFRVTAVDRTTSALKGLEAEIVETDLEAPAGWRPAPDTYDLIVVVNYLHRPLMPALLAAIADQGVLLYETFAHGNESLGRPKNPDFLLQPNELLDLCQDRLTVVAFEQGRVDRPYPAVIQRICARRTGQASGGLPA